MERDKFQPTSATQKARLERKAQKKEAKEAAKKKKVEEAEQARMLEAVIDDERGRY